MIIDQPGNRKAIMPYMVKGASYDFAPKPPGLFKRMAQAISQRQLTGGWFAPEKPLQPMQQQTAGRQYDFPPGYNLYIQPRRDTGFLFEDLKNFARWYDILRLVMQTRMDQICTLDWEISPVGDGTHKFRKIGDSERVVINELTSFFRQPEPKLRWRGWIRALMNDSFVMDGVVLWPQWDGKKLGSLERIDAATIKKVIDSSGRLAEPPFPSYQQILHGQVANEYMEDELLYYIENPANDRVYGYSRVEQAMMTIQIGMRLEVSQLQYFTEGNIPEALASVPDTWSGEQIQHFQTWWDTMLEGDTGQRRHLKFVPDALKLLQIKQPDMLLKPEQNEWVARIVCYAFGVSNQPFIKMMNRATAETAQEEAKEEGLAPYLNFLEEIMTDVIQNHMGYPDFEFNFHQQEDVDPETQAKVDDTYIKNGVLSIDEVRDRMGKQPLGVKNMIYLPTGPIPVEAIKDGSYTPQGVVSPQDQELHDAKVQGIKSGKLNADGTSPKPMLPPPPGGAPPTAGGAAPPAGKKPAAPPQKGGGLGKSEPFRQGQGQTSRSKSGRRHTSPRGGAHY